jgi:hypothetical protein
MPGFVVWPDTLARQGIQDLTADRERLTEAHLDLTADPVRTAEARALSTPGFCCTT